MTAATIRCGDQVRTHAEVRERGARLATAFRSLGLRHGDRYAVVMRNEIGFLEATVAGAPVGAVPVPVNWHWTGDDLAHLLADSGSRLVVAHSDLLPAVERALPPGVAVVEATVSDEVAAANRCAPPAPTGRHPTLDGLVATHEAVTDAPSDPPLGVIYTSGTTGTPKGILRQPISAEDYSLVAKALLVTLACDPTMSTVVPAPLYHTAPNAHAVFALALGMQLEIMPRFDAVGFLQVVQDRRIEHAQLVPTMCVRLLKLPAATRKRFDVSSLRSVVHAAAPCPPAVKQSMIDWLGPIVHEYYGGSETGAVVSCTSEEWLAHPGTVGRPMLDADVRVLGSSGETLPAGEDGDVYLKPFSAWPDFTYIGSDVKRRGMERDGYLTLGDVGHLDADGFLYLSDRRHNMVISGGVNVYPAEVEACLIGLDGVADVAVFGVPDPEFGEVLAAHVQRSPGAALTEGDVRAHVRSRLAGYKVPRTVVFDEQLPRDDSGKLFKRVLKERYWRSVEERPALTTG